MTYGFGEYTYELIEDWAKLPKEWSLLDATSIAIDSQDRVYALNRGPYPVVVFDRDGKILTAWGEGLFKRAHGIGVGPDYSVYCTDDKSHVVYKFSPEGKLLMTLGEKGQPSDTGYIQDWTDFFWSLTTITRSAPPFNGPTGVAITSSGEVYVSDGYGNARVHKFSADGKLLLSWGEPGYSPSQFRCPHSVRIDRQGHVWVPDRENNRIQIFSAHGKFFSQLEDVIRPTDVCFDAEGNVYVSELCQRASIFSKEGTMLTRWCSSSGEEQAQRLFIAPHTIAVDSKGDIYIGDASWTYRRVDKGIRTLQKFARK